jgi:hypothetical protein
MQERGELLFFQSRCVEEMAMPLRNKAGCFNNRQWCLFIPLAVKFFALAATRTLFDPLLQSQVCIHVFPHRQKFFKPTKMRFQLSARELDPAFAGFVTGFNELAFLVIFPMSVFTVSDYIDQRACFL